MEPNTIGYWIITLGLVIMIIWLTIECNVHRWGIDNDGRTRYLFYLGTGLVYAGIGTLIIGEWVIFAFIVITAISAVVIYISKE